jgi:hypothetical protein
VLSSVVQELSKQHPSLSLRQVIDLCIEQTDDEDERPVGSGSDFLYKPRVCKGDNGAERDDGSSGLGVPTETKAKDVVPAPPSDMKSQSPVASTKKRLASRTVSTDTGPAIRSQ